MKSKPPAWIDRALLYGPHLTLCLSDAHYQRVMDEIDVKAADRDPWVDETCFAQVHRFTHDHKRIAVVCLNDEGAAPLLVASILVHESVHVWQRHCEYIGETKPGIELEAYAIENIARGLMLEYCRQRGHPTGDQGSVNHFGPEITRTKR